MSTRSSTLVFTYTPAFMPAGAPLEAYEVYTDLNCSFEIDGGGQLIRKDKETGARWVSPDFSGSCTVTNVPHHSQTQHMYVLFIVCGVVTHMHNISIRPTIVLKAGEWSWVMESLVVDHSAVASAKSYRGCLLLIKEAESKPGMKTGDVRVDAMIGMALCRPALLQSKSARNALELLDDYQLRAISSWHRAQVFDKAI